MPISDIGALIWIFFNISDITDNTIPQRRKRAHNKINAN